MGRPCLWTPIKSDAAVLTGTAELGDDFGISNLLTMQPTKTYRTDPTCTISVDLGSSKTVRGVALGYTNATADATVRVRATDTLANITSAPSLDTGELRHWPGNGDLSSWERTHAIVLLEGPVAYRYWQIDVDNDGGVYYEAGRLFMDSPWFFPRGLDFGSRIAFSESVRRVRSIGGQLYALSNGIWREVGFTIRSTVSEDEFIEGAETIERLRGTARDVLLMLDTENANRFMDRSIFATFADLQPTEAVTRSQWLKSYLLEEMELP